MNESQRAVSVGRGDMVVSESEAIDQRVLETRGR